MTGNQIVFTAIDVGRNGVVLSQKALDTLTNGQAVQMGFIEATVVQVDESLCGLH